MVGEQEERVSHHYPELFHYTTVDALQNIYNTQCLWATHWKDLNDRSELGQLRNVLRCFVVPIIQEKFADKMWNASESQDRGGMEAVILQESEIHLDILHQNTFGEHGHQGPFICSFCAHHTAYEARHGLLSQWRGYGAGGGVAIVFGTKGIEEKMAHERDMFLHPVNHIGDVKYDDDHEKIKREFHDVFRHMPTILSRFYAGKQPFYENLYNHFVQGSTLVKHQAFKEENEIRIVVCPRPTNPNSLFFRADLRDARLKTIRYRPKGDGEASYIELFSGDDCILPIKRVIVGPSRAQNLNHQKITDMLRHARIEIVKSETPFLG